MEKVSDIPSNKNKLSGVQTFFTLIHFLLSDIVVYGCVIPLMGAYIGGGCAHLFELTPRWEVIFVVAFTFGLMYCAFCLLGEGTYWQRLFAFDPAYKALLQIRDVTNSLLFVLCLLALTTTVEDMIGKGMKPKFLSEGTTYVFLKKFCDIFQVDHSFLEQIGFDPSIENEQFELGGAYILLWAMLTANIAKLIYFNTLFAYLRAMEIFVSMKPTFGEDEVSEEPASSSFGPAPKSGHSRLAVDFVQSMRNSQEENETNEVAPTPNPIKRVTSPPIKPVTSNPNREIGQNPIKQVTSNPTKTATPGKPIAAAQNPNKPKPTK